jgi:hypothetical protein
MVSGNTPIIVGVGEIINKKPGLSHAVEPAELILGATRRALEDASISEPDLQAIDSISIVPPWTWPYPDLPALMAEKLRIKPTHTVTGYHGGNQPAELCDEAARRIATGQSKIAIIAGGEALASCS